MNDFHFELNREGVRTLMRSPEMQAVLKDRADTVKGRYGNPDNDTQLGDLKGHNQVYLRGEAYIGWGILDPSAFAHIKAGE